MKVRVNPKGKFLEVAEIKEALRDELVSGCVMSISPIPQKTEAFRINLNPATKQESVYKICRKLNNTGYSTKVTSVGGNISSRNRGFRYRSATGHYVSGSRASSIVVAKVNAPNIPKKPHGLPDPGGKKPKKRK